MGRDARMLTCDSLSAVEAIIMAIVQPDDTVAHKRNLTVEGFTDRSSTIDFILQMP